MSDRYRSRRSASRTPSRRPAPDVFSTGDLMRALQPTAGPQLRERLRHDPHLDNEPSFRSQPRYGETYEDWAAEHAAWRRRVADRIRRLTEENARMEEEQWREEQWREEQERHAREEQERRRRHEQERQAAESRQLAVERWHAEQRWQQAEASRRQREEELRQQAAANQGYRLDRARQEQAARQHAEAIRQQPLEQARPLRHRSHGAPAGDNGGYVPRESGYLPNRPTGDYQSRPAQVSVPPDSASDSSDDATLTPAEKELRDERRLLKQEKIARGLSGDKKLIPGENKYLDGIQKNIRRLAGKVNAQKPEAKAKHAAVKKKARDNLSEEQRQGLRASANRWSKKRREAEQAPINRSRPNTPPRPAQSTRTRPPRRQEDEDEAQDRRSSSRENPNPPKKSRRGR